MREVAILFVDQYGDFGGGQVVLERIVKRLPPDTSVALIAPAGKFSQAITRLGAQVHEQDPLQPRRFLHAVRVVQSLKPRRVVVNGARGLPLAIASMTISVLGHSRRPIYSYISHSNPSSRIRAVSTALMLQFIDEILPVANSQRRVKRVVELPPLGLAAADITPWEDIATMFPPQRVIKAFGRLDPVKGLEVIAEALRQINCPLALGQVQIAVRSSLEGARTPYVARTLSLLRPYLVDGERSSDWFMPGDIVVVPSRSETACLTAQEAMAHGALVVASPVGDVGSFIWDRASGLLFQANDSASLARALENALTMPDAAFRSMVSRGHRLIVERSEHWYNRVTELLTEVP